MTGAADRLTTALAEAETVANSLLVRAPEAPYGHGLLGFIWYERGETAKAVRHLRSALEREPNDADALFYTSVCYISAGQNDQAEAAANRLMATRAQRLTAEFQDAGALT